MAPFIVFLLAMDLLGSNQGSANFNPHPMRGPVDLKLHSSGEIKVAQEVAQIQDTVNFRIFFQVFRVLSGVWLRCRQLVLSLMSIYM